jgi:hypothetical protein
MFTQRHAAVRAASRVRQRMGAACKRGAAQSRCRKAEDEGAQARAVADLP